MNPVVGEGGQGEPSEGSCTELSEVAQGRRAAVGKGPDLKSVEELSGTKLRDKLDRLEECSN